VSETHLDLDALADALAQDNADQADPHLTGCADCAASLAELRAADRVLSAQLSALDQPAMPDDVAAGLDAALGAEPQAASVGVSVDVAAVTTLPASRPAPAPMRWLAAAAAAVLVLGGIGFGLTQFGGRADEQSTSANGGAADSTLAAPGLAVVRNDTGNEYGDRAALTAAVPSLVAGTAASQRSGGAAGAAGAAPPAATTGDTASAPAPKAAAPETMSLQVADPLARLRDDAGLADCLVALLPPDDPSVQPLALDYGTYKGAPAMVVVLPSALSGKLDVFVVGPACSQANDSTLFYTSVSAP